MKQPPSSLRSLPPGGRVSTFGRPGGTDMKKLLYQFDTDPHPAVFDNVVAYDGGADHVVAYGGVTPATVGALVDGTIFTRAPKDKRTRRSFVGGSGHGRRRGAVCMAVKQKFLRQLPASAPMLDSNGSNTTAAAAIAWLVHAAPGQSLKGMRAVVLAGTGPGRPARRGDAGARWAPASRSPAATSTVRRPPRRRSASAPASRSRRSPRPTTRRVARPSKARTWCWPPARPVRRCSTNPPGRTTG